MGQVRTVRQGLDEVVPVNGARAFVKMRCKPLLKRQLAMDNNYTLRENKDGRSHRGHEKTTDYPEQHAQEE